MNWFNCWVCCKRYEVTERNLMEFDWSESNEWKCSSKVPRSLRSLNKTKERMHWIQSISIKHRMVWMKFDELQAEWMRSASIQPHSFQLIEWIVWLNWIDIITVSIVNSMKWIHPCQPLLTFLSFGKFIRFHFINTHSLPSYRHFTSIHLRSVPFTSVKCT